MTAKVEQKSSADAAEIEKFARMAESWWDKDGPFKPLHALNPARLHFIHDQICRYFDRDPRALTPFKGLKILDIGCGGGLLCEPMARLGADIFGVDAAEENVAVAKAHAQMVGLDITYRHTLAERLVEEGAAFDVIINMEVIEHVADVDGFLTSCHTLLKPGGIMLVSTLNRTLRSYLMAIVGAEYVLGWLPRGTHEWQKFLTPEEFRAALEQVGFQDIEFEGMVFDIAKRDWALNAKDKAVNYLGAARKGGR